jgi:hypothetical protein
VNLVNKQCNEVKGRECHCYVMQRHVSRSEFPGERHVCDEYNNVTNIGGMTLIM